MKMTVPPVCIAFGSLNPQAANSVNHSNDDRAPLLLVSGSEDNLVPASLNRINRRLYQQSIALTDYKEFAGRSHLIIPQEGWADVAESIQEWVQRHATRPIYATLAA